MTSRTKAGFTLIEVILVALILGFVAAIATPSFLRAMKGQRLHQAVRSVKSAARYARTMAIAGQRGMRLVLAVGDNRLAVEEGPLPPAANPVYTREQAADRIQAAADPAAPADPAPPAEPPRRPPLERRLDGITIVRVQIYDADADLEEGRAAIEYRANGTCTPYVVLLEDQDGRSAAIRVDFLGEAVDEEP